MNHDFFEIRPRLSLFGGVFCFYGVCCQEKETKPLEKPAERNPVEKWCFLVIFFVCVFFLGGNRFLFTSTARVWMGVVE